MNEIVNKVLLARGKSIFGMRFRKPRCTYSTCRLFTKIKDRRHKFKKIGKRNFFKQFFSGPYRDISIFENYALLWSENAD